MSLEPFFTRFSDSLWPLAPIDLNDDLFDPVDVQARVAMEQANRKFPSEPLVIQNTAFLPWLEEKIPIFVTWWIETE